MNSVSLFRRKTTPEDTYDQLEEILRLQRVILKILVDHLQLEVDAS